MNQIAFIVLAAVAFATVHVGRGDGCKATVDGKEVSLQNGDRYCADETTSKTCNSDGTFNDDKCPPGSKCLKSPDSFRTLCRQMNKNDQNSGQTSPDQAQPKNEEPSPAKKDQQASAPSPKDQGKQSDNAAPAAAPAKPETCQANINGKDQTLNTGDRYCVDQTNHRVCNYGEWVDDKCPEGSVCIKSADSWRVLCRQMVTNPPWPTGPAGEAENSEPKEKKPARARRNASKKHEKKDNDSAPAANASAAAAPAAAPACFFSLPSALIVQISSEIGRMRFCLSNSL
jgi:hypothetical protein